MEFGFTDEQAALREVARRYLAERYPAEWVAGLADSATGYDKDGWEPIVRMGWLDAELGMVERAVLADESGYGLHPVPWWPTLSLGDPAPATFSWGDGACHAATTSGGGWRVSGTRRLAPDLAAAAEMVLTADTADGPALFRVDLSDPGVTVTPRASLDGLRRVADLTCDQTPARLVADAAETPWAVRRLRWRALTLLAAEAVGVARRAYRFAVDHAIARTQFGRPIGSYQGVSFRIADSYVGIELATSLAYRAAWLVGDADDAPAATVEEAVSCATVAARDAAVAACEHAIQVLGGTGITWDHPIHRWYRRALGTAAYDASAARHRENLAAALLPEPA